MMRLKVPGRRRFRKTLVAAWRYAPSLAVAGGADGADRVLAEQHANNSCTTGSNRWALKWSWPGGVSKR